MATSGDSTVRLLGRPAVGLVHAVGAISRAPVGPYAIVGGVAVAVRLGSAHRATTDVDTVVHEGASPAAIEVLSALSGAVRDLANGHRVVFDGTKIELLEVGNVGVGDLDGIPEKHALFVASHAWALESATFVEVVANEAPDEHVTARFATPAALMAMKLHAIEDRSSTSGIDKRAGDGWDIFRLLVDLDGNGALRSAFADASDELRDLVGRAVDRVLVSGAARTAGWMRGGDELMGAVTSDQLRAVGGPLLDALRDA
jgi:Nucleotidyl transferase AbiEii toxin, Type IV TA system